MAEGLIKRTALSENFMSQIFSGVFLDFFGGIREYNLVLIAPSAARYNCIYLK